MNCSARILLLIAAAWACPGQEPVRKLPDHVKLLQGFVPGIQRSASVVSTPSERNMPAPARCAHIKVHVPSPGIDREFAMRMPEAPSSQRSRMPVIQPMPVCPEDVTPMPSKKQMPEVRP